VAGAKFIRPEQEHRGPRPAMTQHRRPHTI
jgi:hypothetical protein